jgi:hypothetical protein
MLKYLLAVTAAFALTANGSSYAQTAKVTVTPKPIEESEAVKAAKTAGYLVYSWEGCVKRVGLCRYVEIDGKRYSAAVPKDIPFLAFIPIIGQYASGLESIPEDTPVAAASVSIGAFSLMCGLGTVGAVTIHWTPLKSTRKRTCPKI